MAGIADTRAPQLQVGPAAQFGDTPLTPGVSDFMDGFRNGFITVDDINKRAAEQVIRPSEVERDVALNEQATLDANTIRPAARELAGKKIAAELDIADLVAEINRQKAELEKLSLPPAEAVKAATGAQAKLTTNAATKVTGTPEQQTAVIDDEQKRLTLEEYGQLFGDVPDLVDIPNDANIKPASFEDWARGDAQVIEHLKSVPDDPEIEKAFIARLQQTPEIVAEYEQYKKDAVVRPMSIGPEDPRYFETLKNKALVKRQKLGVQAASLKALPGILESQAKAIADLPNQRRAEAQKLFMDYDTGQEIKDMRKVQAAFNKIQTSVNDKSTAPQDMSIIFSFMKILDPGSTVREGEYATAQNARGVPDTIMNYYNQLTRGIKLTPEQRQEFLTAAQSNLAGQIGAAMPRIKQFRQKELDLELPSGSIVPVEDTAFIAKFTPAAGVTAPGSTPATSPSATPASAPISGGSRKIQNGNIFERQPDGSYKFVGPAQ